MGEGGQIGLFSGANLGKGVGMGRFQAGRRFMATEVEAGPLTPQPHPSPFLPPHLLHPILLPGQAHHSYLLACMGESRGVHGFCMM